MEVTKPLVTVCIPCHNYGHMIGRCLESVLPQTYPRIEIIISNDASTDNTDQVIRGYKDPRIRYVQQPRKLGIFGNFRACLSLSQAPYALFIGADDYLKPQMLEKCVSVLEANPGAAFCHTAVELFDDEGRVFATTGAFTPSYVREGKLMIEDFLYGKRVVLSSAVFRRSSFDEAGCWSIRYINCLDAEMWFRMLLRWQVGFIGEVLTGFRCHAASESWFLMQTKEDLEFLESMFDRLPEDLRHLNQNRDFILAAAHQRALTLLSTFPHSVERDELVRQLSRAAEAHPVLGMPAARFMRSTTWKVLPVLRRVLEKFPASLRYKLGPFSDALRRAWIRSDARIYRAKLRTYYKR